MPMNTEQNEKHIRTSEIAEAVHVHPNTVRLYEKWGLLQPVPRSHTGHRLYTRRHLEQMRLARIALRCEFVEGNIREQALAIIRTAATGNLNEAVTRANEYLAHIRNERAKAEEALALSQRWVEGGLPEEPGQYYTRKAVSELIGVSIDVLRNWERNGLIQIPRSGANYRLYGPREINRLKIIRALRAANYSMMAILRMMNCVDTGIVNDIRGAINTPCPQEDIVSATDRWISALLETEADAMLVIRQLKMMKSE